MSHIERLTSLKVLVFDERLEGFQESVERKGRSIDKIYYVPLDWESTFEVARRIFSRYKRCAIFTTTDYLANINRSGKNDGT